MVKLLSRLSIFMNTQLFEFKIIQKAQRPKDFEAFGGDYRNRTADLLNAMSAIREQNEF